MHILQVVSLVLSLVMFSNALPNPFEVEGRATHVVQTITAVEALNISDFLISEITLVSNGLPLLPRRSFNRTLTCE